MVITSITLTNFQCYYGLVKFDFKEGLNVVIGDNGAGKSKLYDAFYWVLYDQVFDSLNREFKKTNQVKCNLVSDKAKAFCEPGAMVKAEVEMVVYNPKREMEYTLTRSYTVSKNESGALRQDPESSFSILQTDKFKISRPMVNQGDIALLVKGILPDDVKPYMWFQGEQVDSLICPLPLSCNRSKVEVLLFHFQFVRGLISDGTVRSNGIVNHRPFLNPVI